MTEPELRDDQSEPDQGDDVLAFVASFVDQLTAIGPTVLATLSSNSENNTPSSDVGDLDVDVLIAACQAAVVARHEPTIAGPAAVGIGDALCAKVRAGAALTQAFAALDLTRYTLDPEADPDEQTGQLHVIFELGLLAELVVDVQRTELNMILERAAAAVLVDGRFTALYEAAEFLAVAVDLPLDHPLTQLLDAVITSTNPLAEPLGADTDAREPLADDLDARILSATTRFARGRPRQTTDLPSVAHESTNVQDSPEAKLIEARKETLRSELAHTSRSRVAARRRGDSGSSKSTTSGRSGRSFQRAMRRVGRWAAFIGAMTSKAALALAGTKATVPGTLSAVKIIGLVLGLALITTVILALIHGQCDNTLPPSPTSGDARSPRDRATSLPRPEDSSVGTMVDADTLSVQERRPTTGSPDPQLGDALTSGAPSEEDGRLIPEQILPDACAGISSALDAADDVFGGVLGSRITQRRVGDTLHLYWNTSLQVSGFHCRVGTVPGRPDEAASWTCFSRGHDMQAALDIFDKIRQTLVACPRLRGWRVKATPAAPVQEWDTFNAVQRAADGQYKRPTVQPRYYLESDESSLQVSVLVNEDPSDWSVSFGVHYATPD